MKLATRIALIGTSLAALGGGIVLTAISLASPIDFGNDDAAPPIPHTEGISLSQRRSMLASGMALVGSGLITLVWICPIFKKNNVATISLINEVDDEEDTLLISSAASPA